LNRGIRIQAAGVSDLAELGLLPMDSVNNGQLEQLVRDRCLLVAASAESGNTVLATIGIDLDRREISCFFLYSACTDKNLGIRMITAAEKLAVQYGIFELTIDCPASLIDLLQFCGYRTLEADGHEKGEKMSRSMRRSFRRRQTRYSRQVSAWLSELGIPQDYGRIHRIGLQKEAARLQSIGSDIYGRNQRMLPAAAQAWLSMSQQAAADGVELQAVSAHRSIGYQAGIVRKKVDKGLTMEEILAVSAAPGFSEHHTGRAIDITSPGYPVLEEEFEKSTAFGWLQSHAADFGFRMSFPRNNRHGVAYEPWHWAWFDSLVHSS